MKLLDYIITWSLLLSALPVGIAITLFEVITRKDAITFKWDAFWEFAKKGDILK